jgi:Fic family protein
MDPSDFTLGQRQYLIKTVEGAWAFVPPPLPPRIDISDVALDLADAAAALGELKGAARRLKNPDMLIVPLQKREALTSSAMEGTITTLGDLLIEEASDSAQSSDETIETSNYVRALTATRNKLLDLPLSHRLIKEAHRILLSGLSPARGAGKKPGEYKIHQNAVGRRGETIHSARCVPPTPEHSQICMDQLETYINRLDASGSERLIDLALVQYQFEAIHPFDDGNGRIGRMLITLMAMQSGLLDLPLLHMSAQLERDRDEYIDRLYAVSSHGSWSPWVRYFLQKARASCDDATRLVDRILDLQNVLRSKASEASKTPRLLMIVNALFTRAWTTAPLVQQLCNVTFPTAQSDLRALVRADILQELPGRRPRLYYCPALLSLSERS